MEFIKLIKFQFSFYFRRPMSNSWKQAVWSWLNWSRSLRELGSRLVEAHHIQYSPDHQMCLLIDHAFKFCIHLITTECLIVGCLHMSIRYQSCRILWKRKLRFVTLTAGNCCSISCICSTYVFFYSLLLEFSQCFYFLCNF